MIEELTRPDPNRTCSLSTSATRTRGPRCSCAVCTVYIYDTAAAAPLARHLARPHWGICLFFSISHSLLCRECRGGAAAAAAAFDNCRRAGEGKSNGTATRKLQEAPASTSRILALITRRPDCERGTVDRANIRGVSGGRGVPTLPNENLFALKRK